MIIQEINNLLESIQLHINPPRMPRKPSLFKPANVKALGHKLGNVIFKSRRSTLPKIVDKGPGVV